MAAAFVVVPEGDLFYIMQVCPEALMSASGSCGYSLCCDCQHSDDGPLWQFRGYFKRWFDAQRRVTEMQAQFDRDCARRAASIGKRKARELEAMRRPVPGHGLDDEDVLC